MAKRQSLGRGLNALMPDVSRETSPAVAPETDQQASGSESTGSEAGAVNRALLSQPVAGLTFAELPIGDIVPNHAQPRTVFDEDALAELVHSIKEIGLLQPIVVRKADQGYELVAGERRLRASKIAGLATIPALIRDTADEQMLRDALLENLHRSALTPLEEAAAYQQLLQDFGGTQEELATRLGRSRPQISNTLRLLQLPTSVARKVSAGVISAGHARALLGLKDAAAMEAMANRIVAEGLSVRSVEEIVLLAGDGKPKKATGKKTGARLIAPGLDELSERMSARLDTRVTVALGAKRGKIVIDFATLEDLRRVVEIIDPPSRGMFGEPLN